MNSLKQFDALKLKAAETLRDEKLKFHIAYMGIIKSLGTLYLITKPIAGNHTSARVFIAHEGDISKCEEITTKPTTYSGSAIVVDTSYGEFHFSDNHKVLNFCKGKIGQGAVFELREFTFLN